MLNDCITLQIMEVSCGHWIWERDRPLHHAGAMRSNTKDEDEDDVFPRGPHRSPRYCHKCDAQKIQDTEDEEDDDDDEEDEGIDIFPASLEDGVSWYLSSSTDSSPEESAKPCKTFSVVPARFDMKGVLQYCLRFQHTITPPPQTPETPLDYCYSFYLMLQV